MKMDLRPGSGGDPEETLRSVLGAWRVPSPPPGMEEDLRRAFRGRRRPRRLAPRLAVAAALAGLAAWPFVRKGTEPSVATEPPSGRVETSVPPSRPAPAERVEPGRPRRDAAHPSTAPALDDVVVEPGQAELLVRFAEGLQDLRPPTTVLSGAEVATLHPGAPETTTLRAAGAVVPRYEGEWERVADVWPLVQLSAPTMGR